MASALAMLTVSKSCTLSNIPDPIILHPNSQVTIGRSGKCDMSFPEVKSISHVHCYVRSEEGLVQVKCVSSNKTMFDSVVLPNNEWHTIRFSGSLLLSSASKLKIEIRVGDEALQRKKLKRKSHVNGIAEVIGTKDPRLHTVASLKDGMSCVTIGRSKDCDIVIDNKKISSLHCKLIWNQSTEGTYTLTIVPGEGRNKTFFQSEQVTESMTIPFSATVEVALVFPSDKAVETLRISPLVTEQLLVDPEEKQRKRELRTLEKDDKKWTHSYAVELNKLVERESHLLREIEETESRLTEKRKHVIALKSDIGSIESRMNSDSQSLKNARDAHEIKFQSLTKSLEETVLRLSELNQTKLDLIMN